jgi:hypothetical protein
MVIWKVSLKLTDEQIVRLPQNAQILSAQMQKGQISLWYLCNAHNPLVNFYIDIYGTGNPISSHIHTARFISTFQMEGGDLVFHVFERYKDQ